MSELKYYKSAFFCLLALSLEKLVLQITPSNWLVLVLALGLFILSLYFSLKALFHFWGMIKEAL